MDEHSANAANLRRAVVDCWNTIGVRGDSSCPKLIEFVHCRNCPVYATAAKHLLDIELPPEYLSRWTLHVAREQPAADPDSLSVVLFRLETEWFALRTTVFAEIVGNRSIHSIPHRRDGVVLGLANVRGELLPCVSLRDVLGLAHSLEAVERDGRRVSAMRLLVLEQDGTRIVCPADEVQGTQRYQPRDLLDVPTTISKAAPPYTKAVLLWQGKPVGMLDDQVLFNSVNRSLTSTAT
jgi:chemotaxis-related protein WspD